MRRSSPCHHLGNPPDEVLALQAKAVHAFANHARMSWLARDEIGVVLCSIVTGALTEKCAFVPMNEKEETVVDSWNSGRPAEGVTLLW